MKILIVDDEKLTQDGIVSSIDWNALQIDEVFLACDGLEGLDLAKTHHPELVLSDIRMPRLDGISMAEQILAFAPDTSIIFMSGYSDKDYLKAAIKLKAISYIEKPINPLDVEAALVAAVQNSQQLSYLKHSRQFYSQATEKELALELTYPTSFTDSLKLLAKLNLSFKPNTSFTTVILKLATVVDKIHESTFANFHQKLKVFLANYHLDFMYAIKQNQYVIYHVYGTTRPSAEQLLLIGSYLKENVPVVVPFFIAIGKAQAGVANVYSSYSSAVVLLQNSFFHDYNSILSAYSSVPRSQMISEDFTVRFQRALEQHDDGALAKLLDDIYATYACTHSLLPSQVKDIYYKLFMYIQFASRKLNNNLSSLHPDNESVLDNLEQCHNLSSLHELLEAKVLLFLEAVDQGATDSSPVYMIKSFIHKNYMNYSLSVKTISEHVHFSSSYACTIFKTETGQTLNQYITDYRIEKAKQLLEDPRQKIAEISSQVGYNDGNYFGKSFKKMVGISPSEYRERMTS